MTATAPNTQPWIIPAADLHGEVKRMLLKLADLDASLEWAKRRLAEISASIAHHAQCPAAGCALTGPHDIHRDGQGRSWSNGYKSSAPAGGAGG